MSAANGFMLLGNPRVEPSVSFITQLKAKHGSFKVWCAGCLLALVIVTPPALWAAGVFDKTTPPPPPEYAGYGVKMVTYESLFGDDHWPSDGVAAFVSDCNGAVETCSVYPTTHTQCYVNDIYNGTCNDRNRFTTTFSGDFKIVALHTSSFNGKLQELYVTSYKYYFDYEDGSNTRLISNVTGASDVWQDGDNFYALIATATNVAIYDLKKNTDDKIEMQQADAIYAVAAVTVGTGTGASTTAAAMLYDNNEMTDYYEDYSVTIRVNIYDVDLSFNFGFYHWKQVYLKAPATTTESNTLAFDTTGNYLLATFDNEWALVSSDFDTDLSDDILHSGNATSNVQVAFSPSPDTFKTASGGTIADGIFKQLYVVATKDKLEWYSVDQAGTLLGFIDGLNTPENDDIVSVQWLTQHEVVLFRATSGRQHVPVPGKVFNVDRDDVVGLYSQGLLTGTDATCSSVGLTAETCPVWYVVLCPVTCSTLLESQVDVDHYVNQNQALQLSLQSNSESCTTIDCNIRDTNNEDATEFQLQNGALVAQFLCPETCKAPPPPTTLVGTKTLVGGLLAKCHWSLALWNTVKYVNLGATQLEVVSATVSKITLQNDIPNLVGTGQSIVLGTLADASQAIGGVDMVKYNGLSATITDKTGVVLTLDHASTAATTPETYNITGEKEASAIGSIDFGHKVNANSPANVAFGAYNCFNACAAHADATSDWAALKTANANFGVSALFGIGLGSGSMYFENCECSLGRTVLQSCPCFDLRYVPRIGGSSTNISSMTLVQNASKAFSQMPDMCTGRRLQ